MYMHKFARTWKSTPYGGRLIRTYRRSVILFVVVLVLGWLILVIATHQKDVQAPTLPAQAVGVQEAPEEPDLSGIAYITKTEETSAKAQPVAPKTKVDDSLVSIFSKVCDGKDYCVKDLYAMAMKETRLNPLAVGDGGKSYGLFQIHRGYHPDITVAQAQDPLWAATWTLNRLESKGYPLYRSSAIMAHNGTPGTSKTLAYLASVNAIAQSLSF